MLRFHYVFNTQVYAVSKGVMKFLLCLAVSLVVLTVANIVFLWGPSSLWNIYAFITCFGLAFLLYIILSVVLLVLFTKELRKILYFKVKESKEIPEDLLDVIIKSNLLVPLALLGSLFWLVLYLIFSTVTELNYDKRDETGLFWFSLDCLTSSLFIFLLFQFKWNIRIYKRLCRSWHNSCKQRQRKKLGLNNIMDVKRTSSMDSSAERQSTKTGKNLSSALQFSSQTSKGSSKGSKGSNEEETEKDASSLKDGSKDQALELQKTPSFGTKDRKDNNLSELDASKDEKLGASQQSKSDDITNVDDKEAVA